MGTGSLILDSFGVGPAMRKLEEAQNKTVAAYFKQLKELEIKADKATGEERPKAVDELIKTHDASLDYLAEIYRPKDYMDGLCEKGRVQGKYGHLTDAIKSYQKAQATYQQISYDPWVRYSERTIQTISNNISSGFNQCATSARHVLKSPESSTEQMADAAKCAEIYVQSSDHVGIVSLAMMGLGEAALKGNPDAMQSFYKGLKECKISPHDLSINKSYWNDLAERMAQTSEGLPDDQAALRYAIALQITSGKRAQDKMAPSSNKNIADYAIDGLVSIAERCKDPEMAKTLMNYADPIDHADKRMARIRNVYNRESLGQDSRPFPQDGQAPLGSRTNLRPHGHVLIVMAKGDRIAG